MRRQRWRTVFSVILFAVLFACGGEDDPSERQFDRVRVGIIPIAEVAPLFVGIEEGMFMERGIKLELLRMAGGAEILPGVGTGSIDIGFSNVVSLILFNDNRQGDYRAFVGGTYETPEHVNHALVAADDSVAGEGVSWEGRTVAVNTRNNIEELMLRRYFRRNDIDPSTVTVRAVPFPAMDAAIGRGDVDVASMVEPFITLATEKGRSIVDHQYRTDTADTVVVATYVTRRQWLRDNPDLAKRFRAAFREATAFVNDPSHQREVRSMISQHTRMSSSVARGIGLPWMRGCMDPQALRRIVALVEREEWIDQGIPTDLLLSDGIPRCQ